tara:strand:- start:3885 stop:4661 length:777 start_codon:yes stop_codon:yes gene_type:complete
MVDINLKKIIEDLIDTFLRAGEISLNLRKKGLIKEIKSDNTPVSNGDIEVNKLITKKLLELTPNIPIVSEETSHNKSVKDLRDFWLVDPIDGTYDYINDLEEFTINAGLIINKKPVAGLINAPSKERMFYSFDKGFSFELTNQKLININCSKKTNKDTIKFVSYSNKLKPEIDKIHKEIGVTEYVRMKSSLKFCLIATGEYDGYVAEPRACEWDIAAGHAILENAGGSITDFDGNNILYGKKDFKNPSLLVKRKSNLL